jgi:uncharacterized protein YeaO (DUF488 family)
MTIQIKRVYENADPADGYRVLVDRLWPRGVSKAAGSVNEWAKDLAPSTELRKWYGHDPEKWGEFQRRYQKELDSKRGQILAWFEQTEHNTVTLLFAAKDVDHSHAMFLKQYIETNRKRK